MILIVTKLYPLLSVQFSIQGEGQKKLVTLGAEHRKVRGKETTRKIKM
jgi:hypothetical protein